MKPISAFFGLFLLLNPAAHAEPSAIDRLINATNPPHAIRDYQLRDAWSRNNCHTGSWTLKGTDPAGIFPSLDIQVLRARPIPDNRNAPTVIILPPTGGGTLLDERFLKVFCEAGIRTLLLKSWSGDLEQDLDPGTHDRGSLRGVAAVRQTLSFFDIEKAGIYGTSLGGIIASTAAGVDPRIHALVTTVAGGNVLETLAESDQEILVRLRDERMKRYQLQTSEEYRQFLEQAITINASDWTRPEIAASTWMILATQDTTVPTQVQVELWQKWGHPRRTNIKSGHLGAVVWAQTMFARDFAKFFKAQLNSSLR
jgi:hypothetical protein